MEKSCCIKKCDWLYVDNFESYTKIYFELVVLRLDENI